MRTGDRRSCWRSRCWTTRHSRTYSEKTSEACGAERGGGQGDGAPRAESAARMQTGRAGSFDAALSAQAAGRCDGPTTTARAGRGAAALRVSTVGLDAGARRSRDESQEALSALPRRAAHGTPAPRAQARAGNPGTDDVA